MGRTKREPVHESYETASGPIPYNMTNDYMFRVILQKNEFVLRGLIGALLHLDQREIVSVEITNPIIPGEQIDNKTFVLDINVVLNNNICLNYELNADEIIRQQCMAREEYNRHEKMMQRKLAEKEQALAAATEQLEQERRNAVEQLEQERRNATEQREQLQAEIARLQELLAQKQ